MPDTGAVPAAGRPTGRSGGGVWAIASLLGIGGWIGVTVYVAATNDNPSDGTPVLRTFAVAGGVLIGSMLVAAAVQMRQSAVKVDERLYRRLAVVATPAAAARAAARQGARTGYLHLLFAGLTTAVMMTIIGLGEQGPYEALFAILGGLVIGWLVYLVIALRRAFRVAADLLAPLGLSIVETPGWVPAGGGRVAGRMVIEGVRHGRKVTISQTTREAVTSIEADLPQRSLTGAATMASMTGQPVRAWRGVTARTGSAGVSVRRTGNGAGRWYLYDLLLAEQLAGRLR